MLISSMTQNNKVFLIGIEKIPGVQFESYMRSIGLGTRWHQDRTGRSNCQLSYFAKRFGQGIAR
jgi:hypothetical protein